MAKRNASSAFQDHASSDGRSVKKPAIDVASSFALHLDEGRTLDRHTTEYSESGPYKHGVIRPLIADDLLRSVRKEVIEHVDFTPKETDIYKIHQSGDLANLSGLASTALDKLPSLLRLRDALYSQDFRSWLSKVAQCGPLSGTKTDMAINVYVPGCHLLCHDDVIGTRRLSYILYLTDPDQPWKAEWGGALRLYPTLEREGEDGKKYKVPSVDWEKVIPPSWNQLSFFTVQPGESFHDVEEVYHAFKNDQRVRMAISGWFHIPQEGEDGFEPGLEKKLAEKSSLAQLQGKAGQFDLPQRQWFDPAELKRQASSDQTETDDSEDVELTEADLQYLLKWITPNYLTPDTVEELNEIFAEESTLQLTDFLSKKFSEKLRQHLTSTNPPFAQTWLTAAPPHKQRFQYQIPSTAPGFGVISKEGDHYGDLLENLLPSLAFRKWLALVTGLTLQKCDIIARRFRKGLDYQLAQEFTGDSPQIEYTLSVTPSKQSESETEANDGKTNGKEKVKDDDDSDNVGGYELYMAGDEDEGEDHDGVNIPDPVSQTGAGNRRSTKKADPAIYKSAQDDEDDGILFTNPASWNTLSIVLRDKGVLRFVKYLSRSAESDRWDLTGTYEVDDNNDDEDEFNGLEDGDDENEDEND